VGLYPGGDSVDGIKDLAGNVWEWTATEVSDDLLPVRKEGGPCRVLRGGSWDYLPEFVHSTFREGSVTYARGDSLGFRLAQDIR
jgi:formylglycine-generating enzyme required for sulfatase activity